MVDKVSKTPLPMSFHQNKNEPLRSHSNKLLLPRLTANALMIQWAMARELRASESTQWTATPAAHMSQKFRSPFNLRVHPVLIFEKICIPTPHPQSRQSAKTFSPPTGEGVGEY
jgi:hypothetical protein